MVYLRGSSDLDIIETVEDVVMSGVESVVSPVASPTFVYSRQVVGNIAAATREVGDNLFEVRYSIITGRRT